MPITTDHFAAINWYLCLTVVHCCSCGCVLASDTKLLLGCGILMSGRSLQDCMISSLSSRWKRSFVNSRIEWEISCSEIKFMKSVNREVKNCLSCGLFHVSMLRGCYPRSITFSLTKELLHLKFWGYLPFLQELSFLFQKMRIEFRFSIYSS